MKILQIDPNESGFARFEAAYTEIPGIQDFKGDYARAHFQKGFVLENEGRACARLALYTHPDLQLHDQPAVSIGAYACTDDDAVANTILSASMDYTLKHLPDARFVVGPMDGSTWENYRFALPSPARPFILEPVNPRWYPSQWAQNGFEVLKKYQSNWAEFGPEHRRDIQEASAYFKELGLTFRHFDTANVERELEILADFNAAAFHDAFLITPISKESFIEKYRKIVPYLKPELIWLVEDEGRLCGMFFAIPDYLDPEKRTAVVKTLARLPDARYKGLGEYLSALWLNTAIDAGYSNMVHALMREDNASLRTSSHFWGESFRTYQLYVKSL
jgi:L-amino acid N-acyltransferase YncA